MQILSLFKRYCNVIPLPEASDKIGEGIDGEVYSMANDTAKVIKLCRSYDFDRYDLIASILDRLLFYPEPIFARVHMRGYESFKFRGYILYYYVMEKLLPISEDEAKVFHTILSHEDNNIIKNYAPEELNKILLGLNRGLDFDVERVKFLCEGVRLSAIKHNDIHPRNIMKDALGNFKLIDFDQCELIGEK